MTHFPTGHLLPISALQSLALLGATPVAALGLFVFVEAGFLELILLNKVALTIGAMFTLSAAVSSMRDPPDGFYKWFYRFSNTMTANTAFFGEGKRRDGEHDLR